MKKVIAFLLAVVLMLALVGCGKDEEKDSFKYVGLKVYDPVYVAQDKGFFTEQGLNVEIVDTVAGGATAVQMVSSGDVQGALLSTMAIINARSNGLPVIGVADIQSAFAESPLEEFYVRQDSGIESIEDLRGKKIAINLVKSSFHYTWLMALENAGMTADDAYFISDNSKIVQKAYTRYIVMNGPVISDKNWKRIYYALVGGDPKLRERRAIGTQVLSDIYKME